jgi:Ca2+-binding RTX toxin-like protein
MSAKRKTRLGLLAGLVALGVLMLPASRIATGADQIVIRGAESGSHLRVTAQGDRVFVNGYMAAEQPTGCGFTQFRAAATCSAAGASSILIEMGPNGDKVEILDPMPLPVTVYLGDGSDKFVGNAEPDTCYPQGARRNRCYGGAGNDVCITGPRNSDCVGDGGDDYAKFGTGSDGCWGDFAFGADAPAKDDPMQGDPGNDVCLMGPGKDGAHGGPGEDTLYEGGGGGKLYGEGGDDRLYEGHGKGKLFGGGGRDFCDGGPGVGKSFQCETGPRH